MAANNININTAAVAENSNILSPKLRRPTWNQIVRGGESVPPYQHPILPKGDSPRSDSAVVAMESNGLASSSSGVTGGEDGGFENGGRGGGERGGSSGNTGKRPAWKKPVADGTAAHTVEVAEAVVMGAESWPALSGSTRIGKTLSSGTLKGSVDGSSSGQGLVSPSVSQKLADDIMTANSSSGYSSPTLLKSTKRSVAGSSSNGISTMEQPASPGSSADSRATNPSPRDSNVRSGVLSHSHGGNERIQQHRNSFRTRNGGAHAHGDGHHRQNLGMRRDQERGNQEWNHRNVNNNCRDGHAPQQRGLQRYGRSTPPPPPPLPASTPFITPLHVRPYGGHMAFPELQSPYYIYPLQSPTFYSPIPHQLIYQPSQDNILHTRILSQIDYYFSNENLVKDTFLRQNMDEQGWVPIALIARFNKISQWTDNVQIIMDALHYSTVVEVQGDKVRRRNDWRRWIMPTVNPSPDTATSWSSEIPNQDMVSTGLQSLSLDGRETYSGAAVGQLHVHVDAMRRMPSGDLSMPRESGKPTMVDAHRDVAAVGTGQ